MKSFSLFIVFCLITALSYSQTTDESMVAKLVKNFYEAKNLADKVKLFADLQQQAPDGSAKAKIINYDEMRRILALNYLQKDSLGKYQYYIKAIHNKVELADQLDKMTSHMTVNKKMAAFADQPAASMVGLITEIGMNPSLYKPVELTDGEWIKNIIQKEVQYKTSYALILYREEKYTEAIALLKPVYERLPSFN
jgi:hypothetical protein